MMTYPGLIICEYCDSVYRRSMLGNDEIARCGRCRAVLYRASRLDLDHLLALTLAAAIVFVIANVSPVIRIAVSGMHNEANLLQSIAALSHGSGFVVGLVAAATLFIVPLLQIVLLGWVLLFARARRASPSPCAGCTGSGPGA